MGPSLNLIDQSIFIYKFRKCIYQYIKIIIIIYLRTPKIIFSNVHSNALHFNINEYNLFIYSHLEDFFRRVSSEKRLLTSSCLSVRPSVRMEKNQFPLEGYS
jgi:hypothetical protein